MNACRERGGKIGHAVRNASYGAEDVKLEGWCHTLQVPGLLFPRRIRLFDADPRRPHLVRFVAIGRAELGLTPHPFQRPADQYPVFDGLILDAESTVDVCHVVAPEVLLQDFGLLDHGIVGDGTWVRICDPWMRHCTGIGAPRKYPRPGL